MAMQEFIAKIGKGPKAAKDLTWDEAKQVMKALIEGARAIAARKPAIPASPVPATSPMPSLEQQRADAAVLIINAGRARHGLPPMASLPPGPEELPRVDIDPAATAELIVRAGRVARGEVPTPLPPKGSVARLIVEAGMRARNEVVPND